MGKVSGASAGSPQAGGGGRKPERVSHNPQLGERGMGIRPVPCPSSQCLGAQGWEPGKNGAGPRCPQCSPLLTHTSLVVAIAGLGRGRGERVLRTLSPAGQGMPEVKAGHCLLLCPTADMHRAGTERGSRQERVCYSWTCWTMDQRVFAWSCLALSSQALFPWPDHP